MHKSSAKTSLFNLCSDITERNKNQLEGGPVDEKKIMRRTMRQKAVARPSQIVEGSEEERKRIAKGYT